MSFALDNHIEITCVLCEGKKQIPVQYRTRHYMFTCHLCKGEGINFINITPSYMFTFDLRNHEKIKAAIGQTLYMYVLKSLDHAFKNEIEFPDETISLSHVEPYPILTIEYVGNQYSDIQFYIISIEKQKLHLAFKQLVK